MIDLTDKNALALMNVNKCKYVHLETYFGGIPEGLTFNIFVDTNKLFEGFRRDFQKPIADKLIEERLDHNICAELLNWIVHYRRYFNRKNCRTKFFILHGNNRFPEKWNTKYNAHAKYLNFVIKKRFTPTASLASDIFVVNTNDINFDTDGISVPYIINHSLKIMRGGYNLIISDDDLAYQLLYQLPECSLLKLSSDSIKMIKGNIFNHLSKGYKTSLGDIPDWYINIYLALMGVNDIPPISKKLKKLQILKGLVTLVEEGLEPDDITAEKLYDVYNSHIDLALAEFVYDYNKRIKIIDNQKHFEKAPTYSLPNEIETQLLLGHKSNTDYDLLNELNTTHYESLIETIIL